MSGYRLSRSLAISAAVLAAAVAGGCLPAPAADTSDRSAAASVPAAEASVKPSPTPRAFVKAIDAFVERVTTGKLSYHVAFDGSVRASVNLLPIVGAMDVSGKDFSSSFTYDFSHDYVNVGKVRVQVRGVGGRGYMKSGAAAWRTIKNFGVGQSYVLFKGVKTPTDVRYLGAVRVSGKTLHKIGVPGALLIHPNTIPGMSKKEEVDDTELALVIDDAGRPRSGTWKLWGKSRVGEGTGQLQHVVYEVELTFSKVGSKIRITRRLRDRADVLEGRVEDPDHATVGPRPSDYRTRFPFWRSARIDRSRGRGSASCSRGPQPR